ncbi:TPA: winged helix-turn-helix transcriptional regulator [Candidatus Micrarchaeota archaeon]|nr:winged helix-turn-helix transcriptional regulator [Candidatus Micrarchaeota archaeon]
MKCLFGALAFALLLSLASAQQFEAYFSENSSAMALSVLNLTYQGHYGNYTVDVGVFPPPSYVRVSGAEASQMALANEIGWLINERALETSCDPSKLLMFSWVSSYCNNIGEWADCAQVSDCPNRTAPPQPEAFENLIAPTGAAQDKAQEANFPQLPSFGVATAAQRKAGEEAATAPPLQQGITLEQLLPLVGAFIAVIIAAYLLLHQRQATIELDPQTERLLENETRAGILQELEAADKIPTDLSVKLGKSKATIVEHLETLLQAGFVEKLATPGRKFVFYRLTRKGKQALLRRAG